MQDVDQDTGADLNPGRAAIREKLSGATVLTGANAVSTNPAASGGAGRPGANVTGTVPVLEHQRSEKGGVVRISSPERWEINQLIKAGVLDKADYPDFDEETGILPKVEQAEGEIGLLFTSDFFNVSSLW